MSSDCFLFLSPLVSKFGTPKRILSYFTVGKYSETGLTMNWQEAIRSQDAWKRKTKKLGFKSQILILNPSVSRSFSFIIGKKDRNICHKHVTGFAENQWGKIPEYTVKKAECVQITIFYDNSTSNDEYVGMLVFSPQVKKKKPLNPFPNTGPLPSLQWDHQLGLNTALPTGEKEWMATQRAYLQFVDAPTISRNLSRTKIKIKRSLQETKKNWNWIIAMSSKLWKAVNLKKRKAVHVLKSFKEWLISI